LAQLFSRRSVGVELEKAAEVLCQWHFNYCRMHSAHKQTPTQEAKIAENPMTIEELLNSAN